MQFSLENQTASLSVGEFADFAVGPRESGGGPQGLWRAQLGQHWHNELQAQVEHEYAIGGTLPPDVLFEVPIEGRLTHGGWTFTLTGRIDQQIGDKLREIKTVMRPLPADEAELRADYPEYFRQLAAYAVLVRASALNSQLFCPATAGTYTGPTAVGNGATLNRSALSTELVFVEAGSGLSQTIALTPFDEALVYHQLDAIVEFLALRKRATARRRALDFRPAFAELRPGQETIQQDLAAAFYSPASVLCPLSSVLCPPSSVLLLEAPTGYGKTGCVLEFALGQLRAGRFARLIWLTGKATGQIQVVHTLQQMTGADAIATSSSGRQPACGRGLGASKLADLRLPKQQAATSNPLGYQTSLPFWQVRNKGEHCVNHTFHCVRDGCDFLNGCAERWPQSGLAKFYLDDAQPHDLDALRAAGREARICPYEITRTALAFNDVWIGDFNYVFAPDNRGLFFEQPGFDPAETLLIVDEAHNLPSRVAGAHSHRASDQDARLLLAELDHQQAPAMLVLAVEEWTRLLASLRPTEALDLSVEDEVRDLVGKIANLVSAQPLDYTALGPRHSATLWQFAALGDFLNDTKLEKLLWVARDGELEFTCVDAAPAIGEILRSFGGAILMSATLQPYDNMAAACGIEMVGRTVPVSRGSSETTRPTCSTLHAPTPWRAGAYDVAVDLRVETTFKERRNHFGTTAATIEAMHQASGSQLSTTNSQLTATRCVAVS